MKNMSGRCIGIIKRQVCFQRGVTGFKEWRIVGEVKRTENKEGGDKRRCMQMKEQSGGGEK